MIILGDSFIEAIMVNNENIIHNSLSKEFNNKYNFMNYGLSGSGTSQQFIILKEKVILSNAKYVLQFIGLEDDLKDVNSSNNLNSLGRPKTFIEFSSLEDYKIIPPRVITLYDKVGDFLSDYEIYFFVKKFLYYIKENFFNNKSNVEVTSDKKDEDNSNKSWMYLKGAIHQINQHIKSKNNNIQYKLVITSNNEKNKEIIKEFLNSENIEFIFLNDLSDKMNLELKSFSCDGHWNDDSHKNIAKIIRKIEFID